MNNKKTNKLQPKFTRIEHGQIHRLAAKKGISATKMLEDAVRRLLMEEGDGLQRCTDDDEEFSFMDNLVVSE